MHTIITQASRGTLQKGHVGQQDLVAGPSPVAPVVTGDRELLATSEVRDQWTGHPKGPFFDVSDFTVWVTEAAWP